ncbi:emp24/gp25L/p24 family/GOLD-domain-containing protein [Cokeromyces recurvatus]|uniref:emp24/gp25L/p24 family/GOLD-domain-containing protein n=1 Tax=Cokeromyces recurvatus TaxID=90255 RepID=UPI00221E7CF7|nr:emp24/gp25L/p24 family/GOLD-domain-containing protein [Cokeromyces recurvatus]KAI7904331.1 emp24/gp25L/p24 family/GOLD-domain-containing protein [Cokeromyces recurvatus]
MSNKLTLLLLVALACILNTVSSLSINIPANEQECFFEELHLNDKLTITYQVGDGGNFDIDFWISNPQSSIIVSSSKEDTGSFNVVANMAGRYTYCFSNKMSTVSAKTVSFNAHVIEMNSADENTEEDPLREEIEELAESILAVKAEQEYIVARERRHRDTAESTNTRVKWWSVAQIVILIAVCVWQVHYLKHFFEVKRAV